MSNILKALIALLVIFIVLGIAGYFYFKRLWDNITFEIEKAFKGIDLSTFSLNELLTKGQTVIHPTVGLTIINKNNEDISFKDLIYVVDYQGATIAATSEGIYTKTFVIPKNSTITITDTINVYLTKSGANLLLEKAKGNHPVVTYSIRIKVAVFGWLWLPVTYKGEFTW